MAFLDNPLTQTLELRHPVWQAPLPFALIGAHSAGEIAAAGALGLIRVDETHNCQQLAAEINNYTDKHGQAAICFSHRLPQSAHWQLPEGGHDSLQILAERHGLDPFHLHNDHFLDLLDTAISASPRLIGFANGIPEPDTLSFIRSQGIKTFAVCHSVAEALAAADFGIDYLVLQGAEAGGEQHRFENRLSELRQSAFSLLQQVRSLVSCPIVLWGDFSHGADIVAALIAGAQAVMLDRPLLQCTLDKDSLETAAKASEYDFRVDYRFSNRALRYLPAAADTPDLHALDPMLRQAFMQHYFLRFAQARPLCMSASANSLPTSFAALFGTLDDQMRHYLG